VYYSDMTKNLEQLYEYLISNQPVELNEWVWNLNQWQKPVLVRISFEAARASLPNLLNHKEDEFLKVYYFDDSGKRTYREYPGWGESYKSQSVQPALELVERWLKQPNKLNLLALEEIAPSVMEECRTIAFATEEASGGSEIVRSRESATDAMKSVACMVESVIWTKEKAVVGLLEGDDFERQARIEAGPTQTCIRAVNFARCSLHWTQAETLNYLTSKLVKWLES